MKIGKHSGGISRELFGSRKLFYKRKGQAVHFIARMLDLI